MPVSFECFAHKVVDGVDRPAEDVRRELDECTFFYEGPIERNTCWLSDYIARSQLGMLTCNSMRAESFRDNNSRHSFVPSIAAFPDSQLDDFMMVTMPQPCENAYVRHPLCQGLTIKVPKY
jgi:hypothetical protein